MDHITKTIDGAEHTITRQQVLAEFARYDAEYPRNDYCERDGGLTWLQSGSYHYAIVYQGRRYPPKYILHRLTDAPLHRFCGGESTNRVFRKLGFEVVRKAALEKR